MSLYLDTNIIVPLYVEEANSSMLDRWLENRSGTAIISDMVAGEFGATISRLIRMGELSNAEAQDILDNFDAWRDSSALALSNEPSDIRAAARFVRHPHPKLLMPDAIHLATCQRLRLTLVTLDDDLAQIAQTRSIEVLVPGS